MKKENSSKPKKNNNFLAAAVSLILSATLFAVDLFLLLNQPRNLIGLVGTTLLMLIWIYFFVRSVFQEMEQNKQEMTSYLEAMLKSEKAFFLMQRKVLNEMQQFGEDAKLPSEEIITAQKAIAKVTINRSRENTDALMNSNNQLLDRLADFEDKLSSFNTDTPEPIEKSDAMTESSIRDILDSSVRGILDSSVRDTLDSSVRGILDSSVRDILTEQRTIVENMQRMEDAIKDEVLKAVNSINEMQSKMPVYVQEPVRQEVNVPLESDLNRGISLESTPAMDADFGAAQMPASEEIPMEEIPMSSDIGASEEIPMEEIPMSSDIGASEEIPMDEIPMSSDIGASEEIPMSSDIGASEEIPMSSDIGASEEIPMEEISISSDIGAPEDIIIDGDIGDVDMPEPPANGDIVVSVPEEEELPDLDSLLSSIEDLGISEEVPETIPEPIAEQTPEPEPEPEPEPVEEEKPTMPDMSNPNKMMTPDEIAALLANL